MAPMVMGYAVYPPSLLKDMQPDDRIRFVIDADKRAIVEVERITP